jgi:hypothetical protein
MQAMREAVPDVAAEFRERFLRLLARTPAAAFKRHGFAVCRPGDWVFAGVEVEAGDRATAMAAPLDAPGPLQVRLRLGPDGTAIHGARNTHSLVAPRAGALEVAIQLAASPNLQPAVNDPGLSPAAIVVAIVWKESALRGLRHLAGAGDVQGLVRDEINRLCNPAEDYVARNGG